MLQFSRAGRGHDLLFDKGIANMHHLEKLRLFPHDNLTQLLEARHLLIKLRAGAVAQAARQAQLLPQLVGLALCAAARGVEACSVVWSATNQALQTACTPACAAPSPGAKAETDHPLSTFKTSAWPIPASLAGSVPFWSGTCC